jgi:hypothetical protein
MRASSLSRSMNTSRLRAQVSLSNLLLSRPLALFRGHCRLRPQSLARTWPKINDLLVPTWPSSSLAASGSEDRPRSQPTPEARTPPESSASPAGARGSRRRRSRNAGNGCVLLRSQRSKPIPRVSVSMSVTLAAFPAARGQTFRFRWLRTAALAAAWLQPTQKKASHRNGATTFA